MNQVQESVSGGLQFFQGLLWIACDPFLHTQMHESIRAASALLDEGFILPT